MQSLILPSTLTECGAGGNDIFGFSSGYNKKIYFNSFPSGNVPFSSIKPSLFIFPDNLYEAALERYSGYVDYIVPKGEKEYNVNLTASDNSSALMAALGNDLNNLKYTGRLKISGTMNSYDLQMIRNQMKGLKYLDLSDATIVYSDHKYYGSCNTENNKIGNYAFSELKLFEVTLPNNVTSIGSYAFYQNKYITHIDIPSSVTTLGDYIFYYASNLASITLPNTLTSIPSSAFKNCTSLQSITFPNTVTSIGNSAFENCAKLQEISLPPTVSRIGEDAFCSCDALTQVNIPSSVETIGNYAFYGGKIQDVYVYTIEPNSIVTNTFKSSVYTSATLHMPKVSFSNYLLHTQWGQFTHYESFDEPYSNFYLKGDKEVNEGNRIPGQADGTFYPGSGFIVNGHGDNQGMGDIHIKVDNNGQAASIIADGNINLKDGAKLYFDITVTANKWHYFCFPFNVAKNQIQYEGKNYVFYEYDGDKRSKSQNGWTKVTGNTLEAGKGYIFQGSAYGLLSIPVTVTNDDFTKKNVNAALQKNNNNGTATAANSGWNFIGNPYTAYYGIDDIDEFNAPITIWNGSSYVALSKDDDEAHQFAPFEAFFVQASNSNTQVGFDGDDRVTYKQSNNNKNKSKALRARKINPDRMVVNLTVAMDTLIDKTRIVFNKAKNLDYDIDCDAAKFMSFDNNVPQLYSMDAQNVKYAINERPVDNGNVTLGFVAQKEGTYTISATRQDAQVSLKDLYTDAIVDLSNGDYTFTSEAGTFENRFVLVTDKSVTGVESLTVGNTNATAEKGAINFTGTEDAQVNIYAVNGALVAENPGNGKVALQKGVYIVKVNGKSTKMVVK